MATIEPRLIHLLNESTTPQISHADLPPRQQGLLSPSSPDRPLAPIEPDANHRADRPGLDIPSSSAPPGLGPLHLTGDDVYFTHNGDGRQDGRHAGGVAAFPLRLALGEPDAADAHNHIGKMRGDASHESLDDPANKKRTRALAVKDDFVQLPQPVKKQKATQQGPVMPPIINGLYEPPPHAALFPPIAANSLEEHDANQIKLLNEFNRSSEPKPSRLSPADSDRHSAGTAAAAAAASKEANKARKRATKPRRKWSEEETRHLLLGVNKHGVGKWTSILEDSQFKFNERTAGDLKDRFRTCCPSELRGANRSPHPESPPLPVVEAVPKVKKGIHSENILIEEEASPGSDTLPATPHHDSDSAPKPKKSRAHRKNLADLAELGIHGPFKKSQRRERRPFTDHDDREIIEGLEMYGPAWTKIQRDPRFNFASRQPTDLRDRVRNKYPEIYQRIEKGTFQMKDSARGNDVLEPSVTMSIVNSLQRTKNTTLEPQTNRSNSRDELPRWSTQTGEPSESNHPSHVFELPEPATTQAMGGEMDISRLLLDDSKLSHTPPRRGLDALSGSSSPSGISPEPARGH